MPSTHDLAANIPPLQGLLDLGALYLPCMRLQVLPEFSPAMGTSSNVTAPGPPHNAPASALLLLAALFIAATLPAAEPFSVVVVPDPQSYTVFRSYGLYAAQSRWIRDTKTQNNTKFAVYLGDLTGSNEDVQWQVVDTAHGILDTANIPYSVLPGNHDYYGSDAGKWKVVCLRDLAKFNLNLGPQRFSGESWYGGNFGNTANHNENNYCFFSSGGLDFMVVSLELAPRKEVLSWANQLISQHPGHRVIIVTHAYLNPGGGYNASAGNNYGLVGCRGVDLFDECASRHSNVFLVACGHVGESKVNTKTGVAGNRVYEMVVDYQFERPLGLESNPALGNGWLRLLTFDPDNNQINASTLTVVSGDPDFFTDGIDQFYEPDYNTSPTHSHHKFTLNYNMTGPQEPYTYLNASTGFHDCFVNHVTGGNQRRPDIAQADSGDWAAVWEDDSDGNNIHQILVRGFDSDGNERFADSVVNTTGVNTTDATNPRIAMCPDGRFVVVFQSADSAIKMRTYLPDGTPNGSSEQLVLSTTAGTLRRPDVAIDAAGNYVVTWEDDNDGNGFYQVRCKGFRFDYSQRFATKTVNTVAAGQQLNPAIAMASNGDYVVAWDDDQDSDGSCEIGVRGFLANEQERFGQMCANTTTTGQQRSPAVAMDTAGRFVVAWEDDQDSNGVFQIKGRGFDPTGIQTVAQMPLNLLSAGNQVNPALAMDPSGNWCAVWEDNRTGEGYQIVSQEFTSPGTRIFADDVQVNTVSDVEYDSGNPRRRDPAVSVHRSGRYMVVWADDMDGDGAFDVLARGVTGTACSLVIKAVNGSVSRAPADAFYRKNDNVILTASPITGYRFVRWEGSVPSGMETVSPLMLTIDSDKSLVAIFEPENSGVPDWDLYSPGH